MEFLKRYKYFFTVVGLIALILTIIYGLYSAEKLFLAVSLPWLAQNSFFAMTLFPQKFEHLPLAFVIFQALFTAMLFAELFEDFTDDCHFEGSSSEFRVILISKLIALITIPFLLALIVVSIFILLAILGVIVIATNLIRDMVKFAWSLISTKKIKPFV